MSRKKHFDYNKTYYRKPRSKVHIYDTKSKQKSFRHFVTQDGFIISLFQGDRGDKPKLDFIVKFLEPGKNKHLRTPKNNHWVVSLLLKRQKYKKDVTKIIKYFRKHYNKLQPFTSKKGRNTYAPKSPAYLRRLYPKLKHTGTYSIELIAYIVELFSICEKASPRPKKNV